jgi:hypothetical protein
MNYSVYFKSCCENNKENKKSPLDMFEEYVFLYLRFFCFLSFLFASIISAFGQIMTYSARVVCKEDSSGIAGTHILNVTQGNGAVSDSKGTFSIKIYEFPSVLQISQIGYNTLYYTIDKSKDVNVSIYMSRENHILREVPIFSGAVICINPIDRYFIKEYCITEKYIICLVYKNRRKNKQYLILYDLFGEKLQEIEIAYNNGLYKDPDGNCYVIMDGNAYEIFIDDKKLSFSEPFKASYIDSAKQYLVAAKNDTLFMRYYFYNNQALKYFTFDRKKELLSDFNTYVHEDKLRMIEKGCFFDCNEFDMRFMELIVLKPISVPLFTYLDSVFVFNFINNELEAYAESENTPYRKHPLLFQNAKNWKQEILFDSKRGNFYAVSEKNGRVSLGLINMSDCSIQETKTIKGYPFIEAVNIYDGMIYFLYKDYSGDEFKRLYMSMFN